MIKKETNCRRSKRQIQSSEPVYIHQMYLTDELNERFFKLAWEEISNDTKLLSWIDGYKIPFDTSPIQKISPPESWYYNTHRPSNRDAYPVSLTRYWGLRLASVSPYTPATLTTTRFHSAARNTIPTCNNIPRGVVHRGKLVPAYLQQNLFRIHQDRGFTPGSEAVQAPGE